MGVVDLAIDQLSNDATTKRQTPQEIWPVHSRAFSEV